MNLYLIPTTTDNSILIKYLFNKSSYLIVLAAHAPVG